MRPIDADALAAKYMEKPPDYYHTSQIVGEITAAPTVDDWISVENRLPEEGTWVLACEKDGFMFIDVRENGEWKIGVQALAVITHWQPLPKPPKEATRDA